MSHPIDNHTVSARILSHSIQLVECTIPPDLTIDEWRRQRPRSARPIEACGHVHDTTTRYDHARKQLTFLLVCPDCGTEKVLETLDYEPRFEPRHPTIHLLPPRRQPAPARRAA